MGSLAKNVNYKPLSVVDPELLLSGGSPHTVLEHSPTGSPPTQKKKLCSLRNNMDYTASEMRNNNDSCSAKLMDSVQIREHMKLGRLSRTMRVERSNSILKKSESTESNKEKGGNRVQFSTDVTLHIMDDEGHIVTQCQMLNNNPKPREEFLARCIKRAKPRACSSRREPSYFVVSRKGHASVISYSKDNASLPILENSGYDNLDNMRNDNNDTSNQSDRNPCIVFEADEECGGSKLKFTVYMGKLYQPENIMVKANTSGNRIRVVASRLIIVEGRQIIQDVNERYMLPTVIDPFKMQARIDSKGLLTVEAPINGEAPTNTKEEDISKRRENILQGQHNL